MQETLELQKQRVEETMAKIEELDKYRRVLTADLDDYKYNLYKRGIVRCRDCGKWIDKEDAKEAFAIEVTSLEDIMRRFVVTAQCKECHEKEIEETEQGFEEDW